MERGAPPRTGGGVDASSRRSEDAVRGLHRCVLFPPEHAANTRFSVSRGDTATRKISKQQEEKREKKRNTRKELS